MCTGTCTNPSLIKTFRVSMTLVDPCLNAQYTEPVIAPRAYTITDFSDTFTPTPLYSITPSFCGCQFVLQATGLEDDITINQLTQEITLAQITDSLEHSGKNELPMQVEKDYLITLACRTQDYFGNDVDNSSIQYTQTIKDPCINTDFVNILAGDLPELDYDIYQGELVYAAHPESTVSTTPITHTLCGDLDYTPKYDGQPPNFSTGPFTGYDPTTRVFTAESSDPALIDTSAPYTVETEFKDYPKSVYNTVSTATNSDTINFGNECFDATLTSTAQTSIATPNEYDGNTMTFNLNNFNVFPANCAVTYQCVQIQGASDATPDEYTSCADWTDALNASQTMTGSYDKANDYLNVKPQVYTVTIRGTATKSGTTADATFTFELKDVCDPPSSLTAPTIGDYSFNIEDDT